MIKLVAVIAALLATSGTASADPWEDYCRKVQTESFDKLANITCPDNERRSVSLAGECAEILLIIRRFVPTAKVPDFATYRMMWAELRTEICVHFPKEIPNAAK